MYTDMEAESRIQKRIQAEQALHYMRFTWLRWPAGIRLVTVRDSLLNSDLPALIPSEEKQPDAYNPMDCPDLALDFARVKDPETALAFANQYGMLGFFGDPHYQSSQERRRPGAAEFIDEWLGEAHSVTNALDTWDYIESRDVMALRKLIQWDGDTIWADYGNRGRIPIVVRDYAPSELKWLKRWKRGETVGPAKLYLTQQINRELHARTSALVLLNGFGRLKPHSSPINLLSAIWLQIAEIVTGVRRIKRCSVCGEWMDVTANRGHKDMHGYCSIRERMRRYREKKRNGKKAR